jgi:4-alpha-glucanotransferase
MIRRSAGILIPLFSMRAEDDLGRGEIMQMKPMIDFALKAGHRVIQLLPLDETAPDETSPYRALSVFAIDPLYISAAELAGVGQLAMRQARREAGAPARRVERARYVAVKRELLERAYARFASRAPRKEKGAIRDFAEENSYWLSDYALFRALMDRFGFTSWKSWPAELARREAGALSRARRELHDAVTKHCYFQFVADRQWRAVREYARERGALIGGDLAFSPGLDSAEVWAHQELFDLDRTVGAPPDDFNVKGQRWNLPMPNWERMRAEGFALWRSRARHAATLYDIIRIDHVVGLYRTFSFGLASELPGSFTPEDEEEQRAQGEDLIRAIRAEAPAAFIVAEDLGTVPPWVRESLKSLGIAGYKVMRWERENWHQPDERFVRPIRYPQLSLATTGTHDTETLAVWWRECPPADRVKLIAALGLDGRVNPSAPLIAPGLNRVLEALYRAPSMLAVLPVQDLFGWGARINIPGTINDSNWTYRLPLAFERIAQSAAIEAQIGKLCRIARATRRFDG